MKIVIRNIVGEYFSRKPEVAFVKDKKMAHVFLCINQEHVNIVVNKTKEFTFYQDLIAELIENGV